MQRISATGCGWQMLWVPFTRCTLVPVYFFDPASLWQRGSIENTDGLLRQCFVATIYGPTVDEDSLARRSVDSADLGAAVLFSSDPNCGPVHTQQTSNSCRSPAGSTRSAIIGRSMRFGVLPSEDIGRPKQSFMPCCEDQSWREC